MVVGGVRQYLVDAIASGADLHRFPAKFSAAVTQKNVLYPDRVDMTNRIVAQLIFVLQTCAV